MSVLMMNRTVPLSHNLAGGDLDYVFETAFMGPGQIQVIGTSLVGATIALYGAGFYQQYGAEPIEVIPFSGHDLHPGTGIVSTVLTSTSLSIFIPADFAAGSVAIKVAGTSGTVTKIRVTSRN